MGFLSGGRNSKRQLTSRSGGRIAQMEAMESRKLLSGVVLSTSAGVHLQTSATTATTTLPAPVALSPGSTTSPGPTVTTYTPTLTWNPVTTAGITGYQINLYDVTTSKSASYTTGASVHQFTIPSSAMLNPGNTYLWNVRVLKGTESGPPSQYLYFTTQSLPQPVIISPGSTTSPGPVLTTMTPTLSWHAVTGVKFDTYQINLYDSTTKTLQSIQVSSTATSFTLPAGTLTAGHSYVWNLRLKVGSVTGPESTTYLYFQAPAPTLPAPVAVSPGSTTSPGPTLTTLKPTLTWKAVTGATIAGYQINLHDQTTGATVSYTVGASVTSFTLPSSALLTQGDAYVWNVRALNGTQSGPPSAYLYFVAPKLPQPVILSIGSTSGPGPTITTLTPTLKWNAVTSVNFDSYQINLYDITTGKLQTIQVSPTATNYTIPAGVLAAGNAYVWNLRLKVSDTTGPESTTYLYFTTAPSAK